MTEKRTYRIELSGTDIAYELFRPSRYGVVKYIRNTEDFMGIYMGSKEYIEVGFEGSDMTIRFAADNPYLIIFKKDIEI